ncbi:2-pyrone-4,6-dicarboxylate hydrolase [Pseudomonas agarici]|uniref:2-pyrone-4,6-dicarboxylate hydrolase n=1 Tax=Pseudomonas agarici TaxID=46677 RepID=A0A0X1T594_PSEAA|nr:amidohydrolase family protein [Pseudomonas agarici]AMB87228.1 2-pyrone-4,6-dicarboxylate hydrolase [Pseudomonas agarici]
MTASSVPHSSSVERPRPALPDNACDAHLHILDARFAPAIAGTPTPTHMTWDDYGLLQKHLGSSRAVIVQAKHYGFDNACLLDAIARSQGKARGIAVVATDISDRELERLDQAGVRGLRFSLWNNANAVASWDTLAPLAARIAELGWHIQLHAAADQLVAHERLIAHLPTPLVIDHMGRLPPHAGLAHPAALLLRRWLEAGKTWIKLSGAYLNSDSGAPNYAPTLETARQMVQWAPTRMFWGSDWPHITEQHKPDDAQLVNLLNDWAGEHRQTILVDNPAYFYGFTD